MPIYSVQGPDGRIYDVEGPAGASDAQIVSFLRRQLASAAPAEPTAKPESGFLPALKAGARGLAGDIAALAGRTGLMNTEAAEKYRAEQEQKAKETFKPTEEGWTQAPLTKFGELLGGSLPYMAAPVVAGVAAPEGLAALAATGLASATQFAGSNLSRQMEEGKSLKETSLGSALAAAPFQAALDVASLKMIPGVRGVLGRFGKEVTEKEAEALSKQALSKVAMDYTKATGKAMGSEGLTEAGQQVLERMQAGLNLTDPQARQEYIDNFIGGAVLGGALAPAGRYVERGAQQRREQEAERKKALEQLQKEEAAADAAKNTSDYALKTAQDYDAAQEQKDDLKAQIRRGSKTAPLTEEDKAFNASITKQLRELQPKLEELAFEKNRVTQSGLLGQAQEEQRRAALSPEDFLLEQTGQVPTYEPSKPGTYAEVDMEGIPGAASEFKTQGMLRAEADQKEAERVNQRPVQYAAERVQLAQEQLINPTGQELVDYLMQDPYMAGLVVEQQVALPGMSSAESSLIRRSLASQLKKEAKTELAGRQEELKAQAAKPAKVENPMAKFLEDQDMLDVARQEGMTESDIAAVERMARMQRDVVEQGDLFGDQQRVGQAAGVQNREDVAARMDALQRQLQIAYVQRNANRGSQYRETIRDLIEQLRDLESRSALPAAGELGKTSAGLQSQLGQFPQALETKREAETTRAAALTRVADKDPGARFDIANSLVNEIKAVRGNLRPETITQIDNEVEAILAPLERYGMSPDLLAHVNRQLDVLSQKWRGGVESAPTFTRETTPTETTADALIQQIEEAYGQRQRYDVATMGLLDRIADNLKAVVADPERRTLVGEWLHRATTQSRQGRMSVGPQQLAASPLQQDVVNELNRLEQGKLQENGQLELPERFMPKQVGKQTATEVVGGKAVQVGETGLEAPAKKAVTFDSASAFQKFLASDAVKALRQAIGLTTDTAARMHKRMETFRAKYTNVLETARKQQAALEARRDTLLKARGLEEQAAKQILAEAQAGLDAIYRRLDSELQELQTEYISTNLRFNQSANMVDEISQQIADNVAKFENKDAAYVAAVDRLAALKGDAARTTAAIQSRLEGQHKAKREERIRSFMENGMEREQAEKAADSRTYPTANIQDLLSLREKIISAINDVRKITDRGNSSMLAFLQADMELQLRLQAAEKQMDTDGKALLNAGLALDQAAKTQKRSRKNQAEIKQAQANIAAALGLSKTDLAESVLDIDQQLQEVNSYLGTVNATIQTAEGKLAPKEEQQQSAFEKKLAEVKVEPLTRAEQDVIAARDKAKLQAFQNMTARLSAIPGTRIDFSKRREMLESLNAHDEQEAQIQQDIKDAETGIEEMQIAAAIAEEAVADTAAGYTPAQIEQFQARIGQAKERIATLQAYVKRLEAQQANMQKAYEKAVLATSNDPEIYAQVTEALDKRVQKLNKGIADNEARIAKGEAKSGGKAEPKTIAQARKRLAKYKTELVRVEALRSNRLGITRTNVLTGEKVAGQRGRALTAEEKIQIDEAEQRKTEYDSLTKEIEELKVKKQKAEAAGKPKAPAMIQQRINELEEQRAEFAPRPMGKVSAGARQQTSAPGKFRTGTEESKSTLGVSRQPIVEQRTVAQPTVKQAIADANAFAERMRQAKTSKELESDFAAQAADTQIEILKAAQDNVARLRNEIARNETELDSLLSSKAESAAAADRMEKLRSDLASARPLLNKAEANLAVLQTAQEKLEGQTVTEIEGTEMKQPKMGESFTSKLSLFDEADPEDAAYRVSNKTGTSMLAKAVERLAKRITEGWKNAPEIEVVETERDLPVRLLNQVERDNMWGKLPGLYDPKSKKVYLVASNLYDANDVIATVAHEAAGHFGLQSMLGSGYSAMMRNIFANNSNVRSKAKEKMAANPRLSQDVAVEEVLADMAEGDLSPVEQKFMSRVYDMVRNLLRKLFGQDAVLTDNEVRQIVANAREYVIEGGVAGEGKAQTGEANYRTKAPGFEKALAVADSLIASKPSLRQQVEANLGLSFRTQVLDRLAPLEKASTYIKDSLRGTQMMYYMRMMGQVMHFVQQSVAKGVPQVVAHKRTDGRTEYIIESKDTTSLSDVVNTLKETPGMNAAAANRLFTLYLAALRGERVGYDALNFGVPASDIRAAKDEIEANKPVLDVFKKARDQYNEYNRDLIRLLEQAGTITPEEARRLSASNDYIPFYREEKGNAVLVIGGEGTYKIGNLKDQPQLKQLLGGDQKIYDFLTSSVQNTNMLVDMALRNIAVKNAMFELQQLGVVKFLRGKPEGTDIVRFKDHGEDKYVQVNSENVLGIPAELLVKGMEGVPVNNSALVKALALPAIFLRRAVTASPLYAARQLFRDSVAAPLLSGADFTPVIGALKQINNLDTKGKLESRGIVGGQVFTGTNEDLTRILGELQSGKIGVGNFIAKAEAIAMEADALTRRAQYDSYLNQGLSEMEATLMSLESMNFNRKGLSPSVRLASQLIPFFNAQIQSLDVLYRSMFGKMPMNERLDIQGKLYRRGALLAATAIGYAMLMQDDEAYKNAHPDEKYGNFFVRVPGIDEAIRIPVPFEIGYIFKALPEAMVNTLMSEHGGEEAAKAFKQIALQTVPGGTSFMLPAAVKPVVENITNYSFYSGRSIESKAEQMLEASQRFRDNTSELAKQIGAITGTSPLKIENLIRGYTGSLGVALAQAFNLALPSAGGPEKAAKRLSETPVVGPLFQPNDAGGVVSAVYDRMTELKQVKSTFDDMVKDGRMAEARAYLQDNANKMAAAAVAGNMQEQLASLTKAMNAIKASGMSPEEKREQLDKLQRARIKLAEAARSAIERTTPR